MRPLALFCMTALLAAMTAAAPAGAFDGKRALQAPARDAQKGQLRDAQRIQSRDAQKGQSRDTRPGAAQPFTPRVPARPAERGQEPARDAVKRGEIRPLEDVVARVQSRYPGRLLDVQLDQSRGRPTYHLKMLTSEGRVLTVAVDARTAQILGVAGAR